MSDSGDRSHADDDDDIEIPPIPLPHGDPGVPIDFNTFILSLSSSAAYHLGMLPHPESNIPCENVVMAKQTLDILALLKDRTRGNLSTEEAKMLREVYASLRTAYIVALTKCECSGK